MEIMGDGPYSKEEFFDLVFRLHPNFSTNSCQWVLGSLTQEKKIYGLGYGYYKKSVEPFKLDSPSFLEKRVAKKVEEVCRDSSRCAYTTNLLNRLLGEDDGPNATIIEVEKDRAFGLYYELHNSVSKRTMLNPSRHDLEMYFEEGSILVKKLFSKAPCLDDGTLKLEKLIVDLLTDSTIEFLYPTADLAGLAAGLIRKYDLKISSLLGYAKRRKVEPLILDLLKENLSKDIIKKLPILDDWSFQNV